MIQSSSKTTVVTVLLCIQLVLVCAFPFSVRAADMTMGLMTGSASGGYNPLAGPPYPTSQNSYFTDDHGNILMYVNVLGYVQRSGQFIVRENADFTTILALTGGVVEGVNLKNVLVIRHEPDENGKQAYIVNLKPFYKKGDRSSFIALKPNDTIIFPDKAISLSKIVRVMSSISPFVYVYDLLNRK